jgi:hypothetical protein
MCLLGMGGEGLTVSCSRISPKTIIRQRIERYGWMGLGKPAEGRMWSASITSVHLLALLGSGVAAWAFLRHACGTIAFPYELAAGEELLLRDAIHILGGRAIYSEVNDFPFIFSNYPPLFATLAAMLVPLVGSSLAATRTVAAFSTLLNGLLVAAIVYQGSRNRIASAVSGAAYLGSIFVYQWGAWGRVDATAIALSLLAIFVMQRWANGRGTLLAALLCLLSLYTKQTQWTAPLAMVAWLLWQRRWRAVLGFVLVLGGAGAVVFLVLNAVTSGEFFRHLVVYNALPYSARALVGYWRAFAVTHGVLGGVALAYAAASVARSRISLPVLYFFASAILTGTVGRAGASSNYFLELIAASLILCGLCWSELAERKSYGPVLVPAALLLQLLWFWAFPRSPVAVLYDPLPSFGYTPLPSDLPSCQRIDHYVEQAGGEILTEGGGFALRNGKELYGSPWLLSALEPSARVDAGLARLEEALGQRRFSLVILTWQSYPPRILNAVWDNYERVDTIDCVFRYEVFVPRDSS